MKIHCVYSELVPVESLIPHPKNRNVHPPDQIDRLAKILDYQGVRAPIVVSNLSGHIVKGHGTLMAIKKNGWTQAPVVRQDFEDEAQEYAFVQSDNAVALWAELDLSGINTDLGDLGPDFDIDLLGIKGFEIEVADKHEGDPDEVPEAPVEPKTRLGDIYQLGAHRLMCGDSTSIQSVDLLLDRAKVDMIFTDPPYNVAFNGRSGKHEVILNDDLSAADFSGFIREVCQTIVAINAPTYYVWCNWKFYGALQELIPFKACIVWAKNVFGLGIGYRHQHEFCLFNGTVDAHVKNESDLWEVKKDHGYMHPTQKPIELCERALGNHQSVKTVLDLFGGSGSTMIACEKVGRTCFTMELDPKYCDVIVARWEKFTGKKAELISSAV